MTTTTTEPTIRYLNAAEVQADLGPEWIKIVPLRMNADGWLVAGRFREVGDTGEARWQRPVLTVWLREYGEQQDLIRRYLAGTAKVVAVPVDRVRAFDELYTLAR